MGFLRYWTLSNIPLFALAAPMLALLIISSVWAMGLSAGSISATGRPGLNAGSPRQAPVSLHTTRRLLRSLAVPQLVLAMLALTSYHVQVITRISSGYFIWYFWLATLLTDSELASMESQGPKRLKMVKIGLVGLARVIRYMVLYAAIQAVLFSSFLPPA